MSRVPTLLAVCLLAAVSLSGCVEFFQPADEDEDPGTGGDGGAGDGGGAGDEYVLTLLVPQPPSAATAGAAVSFEVSVTGPSGTSQHAGAHYSMTSTAGMNTGTLKPGDFDGATPHRTAFTYPGQYTVSDWKPDAGTYYVRAHVAAEGQDFWSDEFVLTVEAAQDPAGGDGGGDDPPAGETHTVQIGTTTSCGIANYDPDDLTIAIGDSVQWENVDSCPHTATDDDDAWDSGNIDAGATSTAIVFDVAGTFTVKCLYHPAMSATITVE